MKKWTVYPAESISMESLKKMIVIFFSWQRAVCLEEMLVCHKKKVQYFMCLYKKKAEVRFDDIKEKVRNCFNQMHSYYEKGYIPG